MCFSLPQDRFGRGQDMCALHWSGTVCSFNGKGVCWSLTEHTHTRTPNIRLSCQKQKPGLPPGRGDDARYVPQQLEILCTTVLATHAEVVVVEFLERILSTGLLAPDQFGRIISPLDTKSWLLERCKDDFGNGNNNFSRALDNFSNRFCASYAGDVKNEQAI